MIPERLEPGANDERVTTFARKWGVSCELAAKIHVAADFFPWPVQMVSGYRTPEHQQSLPDGAPVAVSTHTSCPATGADLQVIGFTKSDAPDQVRRAFGAIVQMVGMRWGGGSSTDPRTGFPTDWNHVDLGPRRS